MWWWYLYDNDSDVIMIVIDVMMIMKVKRRCWKYYWRQSIYLSIHLSIYLSIYIYLSYFLTKSIEQIQRIIFSDGFAERHTDRYIVNYSHIDIIGDALRLDSWWCDSFRDEIIMMMIIKVMLLVKWMMMMMMMMMMTMTIIDNYDRWWIHSPILETSINRVSKKAPSLRIYN